MLHLQSVLDHFEGVRKAIARRGVAAASQLDELAKLAEMRKSAITAFEQKQAQRNAASAAMAKLDKSSVEFAEKRNELKALGDAIAIAETKAKQVKADLEKLLLSVPNIPDVDTPTGHDSADNREVRVWGTKPEFRFAPKDHVALAEGLGLVDFARAAKLSGARFNVLMGLGARLERALIAFMLDLHSDQHGYQEVWVPALVKGSALQGTSQLPKFADDLFKVLHQTQAEDGQQAEDFYLIPTAEVPVTNLHAGEILAEEQLPIAYTAYTPCFRSEAGSYGKDTRGLIRQHQFDKVELVRFARPENALGELELLTSHAEAVLQALGLHYRVVELCTGDLGFASKKTYDIEVWLPGQAAYREISSCSWFGDFQARRANIRFRSPQAKKPEYVHTLNGSGLAVGRTMVAIFEQFQNAEGRIVMPEALRPYMKGAAFL